MIRNMMLILLILIVTSFVFAANDVSTQLNTNVTNSDYCPDCYDYSGSGCRTITLDPKQVQSLWDNYLGKGIRPNLLYTGDANPTDETQLQSKDDSGDGADKEINFLDKTHESGVKLQLPGSAKTVDAKNFEMYESCSGDFAYAMIIKDSLRVGKCSLDQNNCSVTTSGLKYKNADSSIDLATKSFKELWTDHYSATKQIEESAGEKIELEKTEEPKLEVQDLNELTAIDPSISQLQSLQPQRIAGDPMKNSIRTDSYMGEFQSVCVGETASDRCQVILLSYFDKYYNSYYSGTLLATTAGPAVIGLSKSFVGKFGETAAGSKILKPFSEIAESAKKTQADAYNQIFQKDISAMSTRLKSAMKEADIEGLGGLRKQLDDIAIKGPADTGKVFDDKLASELAKDPQKAAAFEKLLVERIKYVESGLGAASVTDDVFVKSKIFKDMADSGEGLGNELNKAFFKKDDFAHYNSYYVEKDGKYVLASKEWKEFLTGGKDKAFKLKPKSTIPTTLSIKPEDITEDWITGLGADRYVVKGPIGDIEVIPQNIDAIKQAFSASSVPISLSKVTEEGYEEIADFSKEAVAKDWIKFSEKGLGNIRDSTNAVHGSMIARGLVPKIYANPLNWFIYNNNKKWNKIWLMKLTSNPIGAYGYWQLKTNPTSPFKGYFIGKDEYTSVKLNLGQESVYKDAYLDIFVNAPVNNGDFFGKVLERAAAFLETLGLEEIKEITGLVGRDEIEDVILWTSTKLNCPNCRSSYQMVGDHSNVGTTTYSDSVNYVLELPTPATYSDNGVSLAVFAHHTNLDLKTKDLTKTINIQEGITKQDTCADRAKDMPLFGSFDYFSNVPSRIGLPLGILDNSSMWAINLVLAGTIPAGMPIMASGVLVSYLIADWSNDTFGDCVDSEDGYYVQYIYSPEKREGENQSTLDSLKDLVSTGEATVKQKNELGNKFEESINSVKEKIINVVEGTDKEFLQFYFETQGYGNSKLETDALFLTWLAGGAYCSANSADLKSKTLLMDANGNKVLIDKEDGSITINGNKILQSPLVRSITRNHRVGALEMPQSATFVPATGYTDFFEINSNGATRVISSDALDCISEGLEIQTGRRLTSDSLVSIMGRTLEAYTNTGARIVPETTHFTITGGSVEREFVSGKSVVVNKDVHVVTSTNVQPLDLGTLSSIIMDKGSIVYFEQYKEFMVWARIIAEIDGSQVTNLNVDPTTVTNPLTNCEEDAFDLSILANENDVTAKQDGELMNSALQKAGPYQYFETPKRTFYFYSKLVDGECKRYMQVRDKETGEVLVDAEISSIQKTADGFNVTTADGKTHEFEFSAENGKPILSYNGEKDLLLLAQGRNGSFYYDPKTGKWYVGNSQMLPLDDDFREQGELNIGGISQPSPNPVYSTGSGIGKSGGWDIPLINESERWFFLLTSILIVGYIAYRIKKE